MNDTTEIQSGAPAELTRTHNKNLIFAALADLGVHRVTVDYDGSGDSGQIESIEAWNAVSEKVKDRSETSSTSSTPGNPSV